jgi:uncharacterized integral membrane protein (TIGR00698 family)
MPLAIMLGMALGYIIFPRWERKYGAGIDAAKATVLRVGIVMFGFRLTMDQLVQIGWEGIIDGVVVVSVVFALAVLLDTRLFKVDFHTAALIGAGASICGAAAVIATQSVLRAESHKVSVAVATVVVFGTLGMICYPLLYPYLHLDERAYGVYAGSTIHEVAQVMVAGRAVGEMAAVTAVIEKMWRVMLLAPFLLLLSLAQSWTSNRSCKASAPIVVLLRR